MIYKKNFKIYGLFVFSALIGIAFSQIHAKDPTYQVQDRREFGWNDDTRRDRPYSDPRYNARVPPHSLRHRRPMFEAPYLPPPLKGARTINQHEKRDADGRQLHPKTENDMEGEKDDNALTPNVQHEGKHSTNHIS